MERNFYLIVTAAGSGTRMGADKPKQFLELGGKAILQLTIERFIEALPDIKVVTVLPKDYIPLWKRYCLERSFTYPQVLVAGGITRFHSVKNALARVPDGAYVAVHDGVRPLLSIGMIRRMAERMTACRALVPVMPSTDTLKPLRPDWDGRLQWIEGRSLNRVEVYNAQTPQIFFSEDLRGAYQQAFNTSFTDDASVARQAGVPITWCEGERLNIKITTPEDLKLAQAILSLG